MKKSSLNIITITSQVLVINSGQNLNLQTPNIMGEE
tara:strand:+ start:46 stop:153 length:108 start_codon:yes stop_codon:yes gene_type:complete